MITPRKLALLYALYGIIAVLLLAILMPPYQNPDEAAHLVRADQISHAGWLARTGPGAPALIDRGLLTGSARFGRPPDPLPRALYEPIGWADRVVAAYPTSAIYPPGFYLPAAAALGFAHHNHLTVLPAIELARAVSGAAAVAIGALAIALAGPAGLWLFAVLTLPMALAQSAAVGQDGLMMASCALAAACLIRLQAGLAPQRWALFVLLCLSLVLVCQARPPYAALAFLPLIARVPLGARLAGCAAILAATAAWSVASLHASGADVGHFNGSDAHAQAMALLRAPWRLPMILAATLAAYGQGYLAQAIGVLGWLTVTLPATYRRAALLMLAWAAIACLLPGRAWLGLRRAILCAGCLAGAALGVFAIQYLTWTKPGSAVIDGVQGRYFLPLAVLLAVLLARLGPARPGWLALPVLLFPIAGIVVTVHRIMLSYYF